MEDDKVKEAQINKILRNKLGIKAWMLQSTLQWFAVVDSATKLRAFGNDEMALGKFLEFIKSVIAIRKDYVGVPFGKIEPLSSEDELLLEAEMAPHKNHQKHYKIIEDNYTRIIAFRSRGATMPMIYNILAKKDKIKMSQSTFRAIFEKVQVSKMERKNASSSTSIEAKEDLSENLE